MAHQNVLGRIVSLPSTVVHDREKFISKLRAALHKYVVGQNLEQLSADIVSWYNEAEIHASKTPEVKKLTITNGSMTVVIENFNEETLAQVLKSCTLK